MNLKVSINYHVNLILSETENREDAKGYIDDIVTDVMDEHPDADEAEVKRLVEEKLE